MNVKVTKDHDLKSAQEREMTTACGMEGMNNGITGGVGTGAVGMTGMNNTRTKGGG